MILSLFNNLLYHELHHLHFLNFVPIFTSLDDFIFEQRLHSLHPVYVKGSNKMKR